MSSRTRRPAYTRLLCRGHPVLLCALICLGGFRPWSSAPAQPPGPEDIPGLDPSLPATPPTLPEAPPAAGEAVTLWSLLRAGGWAMWPLGFFSVAVVALAVYHGVALRRSEFCPPRLVAALREPMAALKAQSALELARRDPSYLARMLARGLPAMDPGDRETLGRERIHETMAEFALRTNTRYMLWVNYFSIVAQAAPMLGLLGTVSGMIKAFGTLGREGIGDPTLLASHISEALVTTACGLIIALPALFCYFVFRNRLTQLVAQCVETADELLDLATAAARPEHRTRLPEGPGSLESGSGA